MSAHRNQPALGRGVLLISAYIPAVVIASVRGLPNVVAIVGLAFAVLLSFVWGLVLWLIRQRAPQHTINIAEAEPLDKDVAAYVASYLLPIAAAVSPTTYDWIAYALCATLFGLVALATGLWAVNPLVYLLNRRVWALKDLNGGRHLVIAKEIPSSGSVTVASALTLSVQINV